MKGFSFTDRELQLLEFASQGYTDKATSQELGLSLTTIATYWKRLFKKTNTATRSQAIALYHSSLRQSEIDLLKSKLLATEVLLLNYQARGEQPSKTVVIETLLVSISELAELLKKPLFQVMGLSSLSLTDREIGLIFERLTIIYESAEVLNNRIEAILELLTDLDRRAGVSKAR